MKGYPPAFERIRDKLMPTLEPTPTGLCKVLIPNQLAVCVCWLEHDGRHNVTQQTLASWGLSFQVVLEIAHWNLRRKTPTQGFRRVDTVQGLSAYVAKDDLSSSRALCLLDLIRPWPFEGVLVGLPTRDQLLVLPMDSQNVIQSMRVMALAGDNAREGGAKTLSDQLYWFDGDRWEWLEVSHQQHQIEIAPSSRFMDALERITVLQLVGAAAEA
jgi:hypothetical protein